MCLAYALRVAARGRVRFERVEQQGTGLILGRLVLETGYWGVQPLARGLIRLGITATALSWGSLVLGAASGAVLALGLFGIGGFLAALAGILDVLDGLVARLSETASRSGKLLDSVLDRYVEFFLLGGLLLHYRPYPALQTLTFLALAGSFLVSYSTALGEVVGIELRGGIMRRPERMVLLIAGAIVSPISIAYLEPAMIPSIGYPMVLTLITIALFSNLSAIHRFIRLGRRLSEKQYDSDRSAAPRLEEASPKLPRASGE